MIPEEFGGIEHIDVEVDEAAFDEEFAHFFSDLFPGKGNFAIFCEVVWEVFISVEGFKQGVFKGA